MRFSRYLRTRERAEWTAIFHELHPEPWFVPTDTWRSLTVESTLPPLAVTELCERGLLVCSETEDDAALGRADAELRDRLDRASILYLVLVQGCTFSCAYCPIPDLARAMGDVLMSPKTVQAAIDLWARHIADDTAQDAEYCAIFYGGEPLMNEPALIAGIKHIEALQASQALPKANLSLMLCTNGLGIDRRLAVLFREHRIAVAVGCDGPEEFHDAVRKDVDGKPTYARVKSAIQLLLEEGVTTFASVGITPYNLRAIEHFAAFFADLGIAKFGFNFLRGKLLFRLVPPEKLQEYYDLATDGVLRNFEQSSWQCQEYQAERKLLAFLEHRYFPTDCNAYGNQLVIDPGGRIGNCPFIASDMGDVSTVEPEFRIRTQDVVQQWRSRLPLYNAECRPCDAKSICGGGCAWNAKELKGSPLALDDVMCMFTRKMFDVLLWSGLPVDRDGC